MVNSDDDLVCPAKVLLQHDEGLSLSAQSELKVEVFLVLMRLSAAAMVTAAGDFCYLISLFTT